MDFASAFAVEGLSSVLEVSRDSVRELFDDIEQAISRKRERLTARLSQALSASSSAAQSDGVVAVADDFMKNEAQPAVTKHMLGVAGANIGVLSVLAGGATWIALGAGATLVTVAGVTVTPALLLLLGIILLVVCGRYSIMVMKDLFEKLAEKIRNA